MSKATNLSSDLNLIKELEELKLKQKILINSLNRENKDELEIYLNDLSKKIDFLVEIFKDANSHEKEDEENLEDKKFIDLNNKIDSIQTNFDEKFEKFEKFEKSFLDLKENSKKTLIEITKIKEENIKPELLSPPTPNFSGNGVDDLKSKPKKKWF